MNRILVVWWLIFVSSASLHASPTVPGPLEPWVDWVKASVPDADCPFLQADAQRSCLWITQVALDLGSTGGEAGVEGTAFREGWLSLPGSRAHWPLRVQLQGEAAAVVERHGVPAVWVQPGDFEVQAYFQWARLPSALSIPPTVGLVRLSVDGREAAVSRDKAGRLWLRGGAPRADIQAQDRVDLRVHRKITDLLPIRIDTQLVLDVSGQQREILLPAPVLQGFIPIELRSPLPARIEPDGVLRVQVRPGNWTLHIAAYRPGQVDALSAPPAADGWPSQEVWSFEARHELRLVEPTGMTQVDPQQTSLPPAWRNLPAFLAEPGQTLTLEARRRGDDEPEPDVLALDRTLWLDFDGGGYTVQDSLSGRVTRSWRLEASPQLSLGRVAVDGKDQLITRRSDSDDLGVEVRRGSLDLTADSRWDGDTQTLGIGWRHAVDSARFLVNLPPGWDLFSVSGVHNAPPTWLQRWTLLDLFLVLIAAIAVARLWGVVIGGLALITLALTWHAPGAPHQIWLHVITALALLRVMPPGRLRWAVAIYRNIALLALAVLALPFVVQQARTAVYPQLDRASTAYPYSAASRTPTGVRMQEDARRPSVTGAVEGVMAKADARKLDRYISSYGRSFDYQRIDPSSNVQTGPGLPRWQWRQVPLQWNGPVSADQTVTLYLLSPWQNRVIHLMRILLLLMLVAYLVRDRAKGGPGSWLRALRPTQGETHA